MRKILSLLIGCILTLLGCKTAGEASKNAPEGNIKWKVVFEDQFNSNGSFDSNKWTFSDRGSSAWSRYLTTSSEYAYQEGGSLVLKMDKRAIDGDNVPYHTGGIQTRGKFSFLYGKVEVRAKFKQGRGSWPAIWMMPESSAYGTWPNSGEIDIMEHVNVEPHVHQTIHNGSVTGPNGVSTATKTAPFKIDDFNTYGIIWSPASIEFYVNNTLKYTYTKTAGSDSKSWPFDKPFYLILNQSGGLGWPGPVTDSDLLFSMQVDWVKVYQED